MTAIWTIITGAFGWLKGLPREVWLVLGAAAAIWWVYNQGVNAGEARMQGRLEAERAAHAITRQSVKTCQAAMARVVRDARARQEAYERNKAEAAKEARKLAQEAATAARRREMFLSAPRDQAASCPADKDILEFIEENGL